MAEERPWLKNYPVGVPANINPDQYPDLLSLLAETMTKYKGRMLSFVWGNPHV